MLNETLNELLKVENAGWESLCDGSASTFYGELMTPDALMVLANGAVMTRQQVVDALAGPPSWQSYEIDVPHLVPVGDECAALVYKGTGRRLDGSTFVGQMSSVYVRTDGGWKLALYQQTPDMSAATDSGSSE